MFPTKHDINGIIFDLDGTLLDSLQDIAEAMNAALDELGYPGHPIPAYRDFIGHGLSQLASRALPQDQNSPEAIQHVVEVMQRYYAEYLGRHTQPFPGIIETLTSLADRGTRLGVLSNKHHHFTQTLVAQLFPEHLFCAVFGARQKIPIKPNPYMALVIARVFNISPNEILFVGDSDVDIQTSRNAGMIPVGVSWGYQSACQLTGAGANIILNKASNLLDFV